MIESGEKKQEFREYKPYWVKRIDRWMKSTFLCPEHGKRALVSFSRGYREPGLFFEVDSVEGPVSSCRHPEWGEPESLSHFVINLGKRLETV